MGLLDLMASLRASAPGPADEFWYQPVTTTALAGVRVDAEQAKKISAWYRGRDLLATSLAMLPLQVFERLPEDGGANVAKGHPLYDPLHRQPHEAQDSFQWRRQLMYHLVDVGNAYCRIHSDGATVSFRPMADPRLVSPRWVTSGRKVFDVRDPSTGTTSTFTSDEVFHLMGASEDGLVGRGILEAARDNIGTALATEHYAATVFSRGTLNGGVIENPGKLEAEAAKRMARSFISAVGNWHLPKVLEQGSKWVPNELTPEDAQMLLSRKFSIDDIARWLGVPRMMLENSDPSFGNAEQFNQNFVTFSLGAWLSLWEFGINHQLMIHPETYFAEFTRDALVRGDIATRWQAYQMAVQTGTFTRNEVRRKENMNRLDGLDEPLNPAHLTGSAAPVRAVPPRRPAPVDEEDDEERARSRAIIVESAARIVRKEIKAVQRLAVRHAANGDAFAAAVTEFYADHRSLLHESLLMSVDAAEEYCASQAAQAVADGVIVVERWELPTYAAGLAAWALESGRIA